MSSSIASVVGNDQKECWLLSLQLGVLVSWKTLLPTLWSKPQTTLPHSLPAYSSELYTCCYETWVLPVMPIPLWSWPGVTRTMWGDTDQPTVDVRSSFRTRFFSLEPGLLWPWSSFPSKVTFGRGGTEATWSPGFCAPGFLVIFFLPVQGVLPRSLPEDSVSSCLSFSQDLSRSWGTFWVLFFFF